ncbi:hypothetical protein Moror_15324 [Moniliophthora roreri MCA 2997]|uniref:Uncharacterized protein n=2 Tax=Moniliophthora roreri TaxID=221103 RepID=V2X4X6_MONRO|nr:hypothetical protein Moror_15324 [Moniliophthora roreri MCA 2997]
MQIKRGPAFSYRGYFGSLKVVNDGCQILMVSEMEIDEAVARMIRGRLKQVFSSVWSGVLSVVSVKTPPIEEKPGINRLKLTFCAEQSRLKDLEHEDFRKDPVREVLAEQAEALRAMVAELEGQCRMDEDRPFLTSAARTGKSNDLDRGRSLKKIYRV